MVAGPNQSLPGSSEISAWKKDLSLAKLEERERKKIFPSFFILREIGNENHSLKNGGGESRTWKGLPESLLEGKKAQTVSQSDFFFFTNVFFSVLRILISIISSSFYSLLTLHSIWDAYKTKKHTSVRKVRKRSGLRRLPLPAGAKNQSRQSHGEARPAKALGRGPELGGGHSLWSSAMAGWGWKEPQGHLVHR